MHRWHISQTFRVGKPKILSENQGSIESFGFIIDLKGNLDQRRVKLEKHEWLAGLGRHCFPPRVPNS